MTATLVAAPSVPDTSRATVRWVVSLFGASVLLQRISLPGGTVALLLPLMYIWCVVGVWRGVLLFDRRRSFLYLAAAAATAGVTFLQLRYVVAPIISVTSWGLFMAIWLPAVLGLVDRSRETLARALRGCVTIGVVLAAACVLMQVVQLLGVPYTDYLAAVIPETFLVQGYVITYPLEYASSVYRSNAWIGLEPSIVSLQLGACFVLALLLRSRPWVLALLLFGMACTVSGSGILVVGVAVIVMLLMPIRRQLLPYTLVAAVAVALILLTTVGQQIASRVGEATFANSSTALRAIEPYRFIWPRWVADVSTVLFGKGAGSSQRLIEETGRAGLLVPSPVKVFFDYGLLAGLVLAVFLLFCYVGGPTRSLAVGLAASSWLLQPGTTTIVLIMPTLLFVTWWAPRIGLPIESDPLPMPTTEAVP